MDEEIAEAVRWHGWDCISVCDAEPPFVYSIGLMQTFGHPELVLLGLEPNIAHSILAGMVELIGTGMTFADPQRYAGVLAGEATIATRRVHPTQHPLYLGFAMGYCRTVGRIGELEAVQVFWPDKQGKFPFEIGCDLDVFRRQPRLDNSLTPSEIAEFEQEYGDPWDA